jgi:protoporphyrinogen oxidase
VHVAFVLYFLLCNICRGHTELVTKIQEQVAQKCPGLFLGGNYLTGVSIGDCIEHGAEDASTIESYLLS